METYSDMRRRQQAVMPKRKPWLDAARIPFRDDALMIGPPSCAAADFDMPRLRRCPFDPDSMIWEARIGGGLDGYVWKVWFGEKGPFALKLFWDYEPPTFPHYYAPQRECQNAALLQMMETAVEQAAAASRPIMLKANPRTWDDAMDNQAAFSDEARLKQQQQSLPPVEQGPDSGLAEITTMPRMRKCYGWLSIKSEIFAGLRRGLSPPHLTVGKIKRSIASGKEYTAVVYEYVEEGENNPDAIQEALDFFWLAGFSETFSPLLQNWMSGILVDLCDIIPPRGYGWKEILYRKGPGSALALIRREEERRSHPFVGLRPLKPPQAQPDLRQPGMPAPQAPPAHSYNLRPRS